MAYRNGNYCAFYVDGSVNPCNLFAYSKPDFNLYQLLRAWKSDDRTFPFVDSHAKTYNVRDESDWEATLKPRLHERLRESKNIILFLSSHTKGSRALDEEMRYGISSLGLPVIAVYPELYELHAGCVSTEEMSAYWRRLPAFQERMLEVPTLHIPMKKDDLRWALQQDDFTVQGKAVPGVYYRRAH